MSSFRASISQETQKKDRKKRHTKNFEDRQINVKTIEDLRGIQSPVKYLRRSFCKNSWWP